MKIAILTLPLHTNYGGILQAYALQTVLKRMGHEVEVLQKTPTPPPFTWRTPLGIVKRVAIKILKNPDTPVFPFKKKLKEKPIIEQNTQRFINQYINLRYLYSLKDLKPSDFQMIVVGSDQIWRKPYFNNMWQISMENAYLAFTKGWNITRLSYAASFGRDDISEYSADDIKKCREAINIFDSISVREDSGIDICRSVFNVHADHVLDPTMLINKKDYEEIVRNANVKRSQGDLLCYILDPDSFKEDVVKRVADSKNLTPFNVKAASVESNLPIENRIQPPVENWLRGFMDAEYVVTDSFHACVFSIIFNKPFWVVSNPTRGVARFTSLLKLFGLEDRLVLSLSEIDWLKPIDWEAVNTRRSELANISISVLSSQL